jgi:hypothetical protein
MTVHYKYLPCIKKQNINKPQLIILKIKLNGGQVQGRPVVQICLSKYKLSLSHSSCFKRADYLICCIKQKRNSSKSANITTVTTGMLVYCMTILVRKTSCHKSASIRSLICIGIKFGNANSVLLPVIDLQL